MDALSMIQTWITGILTHFFKYILLIRDLMWSIFHIVNHRYDYCDSWSLESFLIHRSDKSKLFTKMFHWFSVLWFSCEVIDSMIHTITSFHLEFFINILKLNFAAYKYIVTKILKFHVLCNIFDCNAQRAMSCLYERLILFAWLLLFGLNSLNFI